MAGSGVRRVAAKRDANEAAIVAGLLTVPGVTAVVRVNAKDDPDLAVVYKGRTHWLEVKNPRGKGTLTTGQIKRFASFGTEVWIVESLSDALHAIGAPCLERRQGPID